MICELRPIACACAFSAPEPLRDRSDEALLLPIEYIVRQIAFHGMLEQPFAMLSAYALAIGQAGGEFDQSVIQQRLARFEADRHAGSIHFRENVSGQPEFEIGILRRSSPLWAGALCIRSTNGCSAR